MSQFLIPRPRNGDGTVIPALLVGLLVAGLVAQFVVAPPVQPVGGTARVGSTGRSAAPAALPAASAAPVIRARPIFTPARSGTGRGAGPAGDPLAGSQVAGTWSVGRQVNLVLRHADGSMRNLHVGQSVNQWVLTAVTPAGARFVREGTAVVIPLGGTTPPSPASQPSQSEVQQ